MRIAEKTLELSLCSQLACTRRPWGFPLPHGEQPLWFGLTQKQEARAGFDAATRLGNRRLLLLQFKAGRRLKRGGVRFHAHHSQMAKLQARVRSQHRLVYYVLPAITETAELHPANGWILESTWFLDVAAIPSIAAPKRRSGQHLFTLDDRTGIVEIRSDPISVRATRAFDVALGEIGRVGARYENFEKFWSYAHHLSRRSVALALPEYP